jgi:RNA polymerase sigma factor (sigma-70 family)
LPESETIQTLAATLYHEQSGKLIAVLSRRYSLASIDLVTDAVQDAFETALTHWQPGQLPENPAAWLMQVSKNKLLNLLKKENRMVSNNYSVYQSAEASVTPVADWPVTDPEITDSLLRMLYACCYHDFSTRNQVLLTLNLLAGLGVPEIARGLLMEEEAVKKALTRSKAALRSLPGLLETPLLIRSADKTRTVLRILYLIFNEGYKTTRQENGIDDSLCVEALRLARLLNGKFNPLRSDTQALLALFFFNLSRFPARLDEQGGWLNLAEQNRRLWNRELITEAYRHLNAAMQNGLPGKYYLEALISSVHCAAPAFEDTDWQNIIFLYRQLESLEPDSITIRLNRILAESYLQNPVDCIPVLKSLPALKDQALLPAALGDVYERAGYFTEAIGQYQTALQHSRATADCIFFERRIGVCKEKMG